MRLLFVLLVVLAIAGYALTGVVEVRPGERAVVRRFGQVLDYKPGPGLWVGLPWGMDRVDRVAVDFVQSVTVGYQDDEARGEAMPSGQLLTGDQNLVDVQAILYYRVRADQLEDYVVQREQVPELLTRAAEAALAQWVAGHTIDDVLLNGKNALRPELVSGTQKRIESYGLGVEVLDAQVSLIAAPGEVKPAFDNVAQAQTRIATLLNQAEQEAETRLRAAGSEAYRIRQAAAAYAGSQKLLADRDAGRFLERLKQYRLGAKENPQYLRQIWEDERGKLFAKLKENGQIGWLDQYLGADGLELMTAPLGAKK